MGEGSPRYEYTIADYLSNARLMFSDKNGNGQVEVSSDPEPNEVLEEHHYYPFGMSLEGEWLRGAGRENRCRFNGKELNEEFGLN